MAKRSDFKRIGLLLPSSNTVQEPELYRALPPGYTLHVTRLQLSNIEATSTLRIGEQVEDGARKLADADVDLIVLAATAPSSRKGLGYDKELIQKITAASGKPATTAATALIDALNTINAKQIVLGAPWSDDVNKTTANFIEQNGFKVLAQKAIGLVANLEVGLLDPQGVFDMGRQIVRPDADAVMLACGNWNTFPVIDRLEREIKKPVLTTNQVSLWHILKMTNGPALPGFGTLLRDYLGRSASGVAAE